MSPRLMSLYLPRLASELAMRRMAFPAPPLAIIARQGNRDMLVCLNAQAEQEGLRVGQILSDARALYPALTTLPHQPGHLAQTLFALRRWAVRYSPWVAVEGEDGLVLDITGAAHLRGGEAALAAEMRQRLRAMGISARIAIAPTRGAAWGLARHGDTDIILTEDAATAIDPLPIAALRVPEETCAGLARLGLRQVRDLARTPRPGLARRFGAELLMRLDQARGALGEPIAAPAETPVYAVRLSLPEPIGLTADVRAGLERLLARLCETLAANERGARRLRLELQRCEGGRCELEITLARPMRDRAAILALFERPIDELDAGFGFDMLRLSAPLTEALPPAQLTGAARSVGADELSDLMTRLGNRVGLDAITRFLPAQSHIPERAFQVASAAFTQAPPPHVWPRNSERPLRIFTPEPLIGMQSATPPQRFRWRRRHLTTARATGPERLTPEWWLDDPNWRSGVRDYWQIETAEGPRLWAFHTPQTPAWAVQGEFA